MKPWRSYALPHGVERDDAPDFRDDAEDEADEEESDEADALGGAADPPDEAGQEESEAQRYQRICEELKMEAEGFMLMLLFMEDNKM